MYKKVRFKILFKELLFLSLTLLVFVCAFSVTSLQAQAEDFNTRVISDHIYAMHLYRDKMLKDKDRPQYHFVMPEGMAHPYDPNGAIYWNGRYHLFYIFQPYPPRHGHRGDCWAHISSHDLLHWRFHPTALKPGEDGPEVAIYSGNAFLDKQGVPTIIYQGLGAGNCIAQALDEDLNSWQKSAANPVIPYPEYVVDNDRAVFRSILDKLPEYGKYDVWDPHAWLEGDTYYAISGDNDTWPAEQATLWKSKDLEDWQLVGDFFHHGEPDGVLDCPDFFKLGDKYVLVYLGNGLDYVIGDFKDEQFYPQKYGTMTWKSGMGYAPESMLDNKGRRIMWAGLYDSRPVWGDAEYFQQHAWDGVLTLPRVLNLDNDNDLLIEPVGELQNLRSGYLQNKDLKLNNSELLLEGVEGRNLELQINMIPKGASEFGVRICASPGGEEQTVISYNAAQEKMIVDLTRTTLNKESMHRYYENYGARQQADLQLKSGQSLDLTIFIDGSVLEVFVNKRLALAHRIYPTRDDAKAIVLFSKGGAVDVPVVNSWKMFPSNPW